MITKKQIAKLVVDYDLGDFVSINDIIRFTHEHYEALGYQFDWIEDGGMWAIAFGNKSKALKYGAIVFDWEVKFTEGDFNLLDVVDFLYSYAKDCRYYNKLKITQ